MKNIKKTQTSQIFFKTYVLLIFEYITSIIKKSAYLGKVRIFADVAIIKLWAIFNLNKNTQFLFIKPVSDCSIFNFANVKILCI